MKFIKLDSRGGNYLVVASNVAWLRTAENGQTNVGMVGGQPLLVVGSIEEVAAKIMAELAGVDVPTPTAQPDPVAPQPIAAPAPPAAEPVVAALEPELEQEPEPEAIEPESVEPQPSPPAPEPVARLSEIPSPPVPTRPRPASARSASMWERPAATAAQTVKVKASSQRMMGRFE